MTAEKTTREDIARAIADGDPVDWERLMEEGVLSADETAAFQVLERMRRIQDGAHEPGEISPRDKEILHERGFVILEELGRGARSRVYRARDRSLDREAAVKIIKSDDVLSPRERRRFIEEARAFAALEHPNIAQVYSVDEHDGGIRLCLERVRGRTLARAVEEAGPFETERAVRIALELCRALEALHAQGIVHRDLSPRNVMLADAGRVMLLDFGLAHFIGPEDLTTVESIAETPIVMAPEQFTPGSLLGPEVDIYALGVLLRWMVTGEYPFESRTYYELRDRVLAGEAVPLDAGKPDLPRVFVKVVERAMALQPGDRFDSAAGMAGALEDVLCRSGFLRLIRRIKRRIF